MTNEKLVSAYLQNQTLEQAEEYVKRGRSLAGEGTEELKQRWIKAFQQWVKSVEEERRQHHSDRRERDDIEAELLIRNVDLPYDAVKKEQDALIEATNLVVEKLQRDPTRLWKIEEELQEDLAAFQNKSKKHHQTDLSRPAIATAFATQLSRV
ncbi:MAG TPA: hypothetical protein VNZ53_14840 [Steroidobacteraceae bacterium]|nr:hypothetical protein [Steroidobacteraceae bacterium]